MALAAIPVPVNEGSSLPFLDKVFVSMGDEQSLEENLSTFTAQIRHFSRVWPEIDDRSLVILDEFGVGTDPSQGAALAQAVVDSLLESGAYVGVATHFPALKAYGLSRDGVRAASVIFDPDTKKPLFRLGYDQVGASQALDVAREQGLPEPILARAQEYLYLDGNDSSEVFDRINDLAARKEEELRELARRREVLERKHDKLQKRLDRERTEVLSEIKARAQEIVRRWQQEKQGRKEALRNLSELRDRIGRPETAAESRPPAVDLTALKPGMHVTYGPWGKTGLVRAVDERRKKVQLDIGSVTLWAGVDDLAPEAKQEKPSRGVTVRRDLKGPAPSMRLDLRGMRADEAVAELERFVDRAVLSGRESLEVVHGKGTGALRGAVHEFLERCPSVQDFAVANADEGGEGVTRITLQ
jgi:DNA mismatch repair protein MutS2